MSGVGGRNDPAHLDAGNQSPQRFKLLTAHRRIQQVTHVRVRQECQETLTPLETLYASLRIVGALGKHVDGRERQ